MKHILFITSLFLVLSCSKDEYSFESPLVGSWESVDTDENGMTTYGKFVFYENGKWDWTNIVTFGPQIIGRWGFLNLDWKDITDDVNAYSYGKVSTSKTTRVIMLYDEKRRSDAGYFRPIGADNTDLSYVYHHTVLNFRDGFNTVDGYNLCAFEELGDEDSVCSSYSDNVQMTMSRIND